ncbi:MULTISPECIES: tripartite tricarboxylate transporter TctB family protein [Nocardioides]|uniref:Tripartite tricarboxylate transporter TctB family protein n=1 Tax=Nocardioides vastitatis TaxID=2568655 RepID=A0ABW0ZIZ7_9ACTN|nr:tripartite tricarboxylate transporter TctB family protein [Nocardioides sp.]THJ09212.1 tripartite tricarboxylate transporter TctB family protein [Nocardioides sp.]
MTGSDSRELGAVPDGGRAGHGAEPGELDVDDASSSPVGPLIAGVVMIGFGILMLTQTLAIKGEGFEPEGPRFMPMLATVVWLGLSTVYLVQQLLRMARSRDGLPVQRFAHSGRVVALLVLLVAYAYAIDPVGYIISTAVFFVSAARVLGSGVLARDVTVAVGLSVGVYFVFTRLLGVYLPPGVLPL